MRDDTRDITVIETDSGSGMKWFVYGALLGAGLGLLFAPRSGEETRTDISRRARRFREEAGEKIEEFASEVETRGRKLKGAVEEWADEVAGEVRDGKREFRRTATSARDDLERRLADARMRRRAAISGDDGAAVDVDDELDTAGDGGFDRENANGDRIG